MELGIDAGIRNVDSALDSAGADGPGHGRDDPVSTRVIGAGVRSAVAPDKTRVSIWNSSVSRRSSSNGSLASATASGRPGEGGDATEEGSGSSAIWPVRIALTPSEGSGGRDGDETDGRGGGRDGNAREGVGNVKRDASMIVSLNDGRGGKTLARGCGGATTGTGITATRPVGSSSLVGAPSRSVVSATTGDGTGRGGIGGGTCDGRGPCDGRGAVLAAPGRGGKGGGFAEGRGGAVARATEAIGGADGTETFTGSGGGGLRIVRGSVGAGTSRNGAARGTRGIGTASRRGGAGDRIVASGGGEGEVSVARRPCPSTRACSSKRSAQRESPARRARSAARIASAAAPK
jgi:hypothetical protein